jgi:hypothetical protein
MFHVIKHLAVVHEALIPARNCASPEETNRNRMSTCWAKSTGMPHQSSFHLSNAQNVGGIYPKNPMSRRFASKKVTERSNGTARLSDEIQFDLIIGLLIALGCVFQ